MPEETINGLDCIQGLVYVDATLGGAGHSVEIIKRILPNGRLIGFEVDPAALKCAQEKLSPWSENVTIFKANYSKISELLRSLNIEKITGGILFDLGASYFQLTSGEKGFSFLKESKLDMRFDPENPLTAYVVVNKYSEDELKKIFKEYGEERFSGRIAGMIVKKRREKPIETTTELADIIKHAYPFKHSRVHPATRVFQAIRIEVNNELKNFENTLKSVVPLLEKNARIAVISFHSLEDRIVKNLFKYYNSTCNCPPNQLICKCETRKLEIITKKPLTASAEEIRRNPSSRSAKLRIARKV
jgi:16S rRNA (cytosine1402-N4)-methyltransferase